VHGREERTTINVQLIMRACLGLKANRLGSFVLVRYFDIRTSTCGRVLEDITVHSVNSSHVRSKTNYCVPLTNRPCTMAVQQRDAEPSNVNEIRTFQSECLRQIAKSPCSVSDDHNDLISSRPVKNVAKKCLQTFSRKFSARLLGGTQRDGVPQLIFRNFSVPLLLLRYNHNAQPVLGTFFFLK
jgi:hypothetical protein